MKKSVILLFVLVFLILSDAVLADTEEVPVMIQTAAPPVTLPETEIRTTDSPRLYTVEKGDNCWSIAVEKFGVDFDLFMTVNNMDICRINPGDQVIIPDDQSLLIRIQSETVPTPTESPQLYMVVKGDNCWSIAVEKFGVDFDLFMAVNNMEICRINPGDYVIIPSAGQEMPVMVPQMTATPRPEGPLKYTVVEGDNCWSIAVDKFGVNFELFMLVNDLKTCNINVGDELIIPEAGQEMPTMTPIPLEQYGVGQQIEYVVEMNDTYADIASKFNTTLDSLARMNNLRSTTAFPQFGQVLTIEVNLVTPTPTPTATEVPAE